MQIAVAIWLTNLIFSSISKAQIIYDENNR